MKTTKHNGILIQATEICGQPAIVRFAPLSAGHYSKRVDFLKAVDKAYNNIGFKRDGRCKCGWRKMK